MLFACTENFAALPEHSRFATKPVICSSLMIHDRETLARLTSKPRLFDDLNIPAGWRASTPDKTVETFQDNFQFHAMVVPLCPKETNSPPSPPLVQCCFGLAAQAWISCVTTNNIAIGEGYSLLICISKHFCQGECRKIGILVMCLTRFCPRLSRGVYRHSLTVM